jgi:hypothetical protein
LAAAALRACAAFAVGLAVFFVSGFTAAALAAFSAAWYLSNSAFDSPPSPFASAFSKVPFICACRGSGRRLAASDAAHTANTSPAHAIAIVAFLMRALRQAG